MPSSRNVTLKPGTFWSNVFNRRGAPVTLASSIASPPGSFTVGGSSSSGRAISGISGSRGISI
jgi:hypothetical protein